MTAHSILAALLLALAVPVAAQPVDPRPVQVALLVAREAETPVVLQSATVDVEVVAGLARTTLDLVFHNPNARMLEGELAFPLQPGQDVVGFALDIDGQMRPAVPVEKAKGRQVFEAIERRQVDPALFERTEGNFFRLRIYPIPAQGTRRVRISLAESLERRGDAHQLRLPLEFARGLGGVELRVRGASPELVGAPGGLEWARRGRERIARLEPRHLAAPGLALRYPLRDLEPVQVQRFEADTWFVADVPVAGDPAPRGLPKRVGLLWDASGSGRKRDTGLDLAVLDGYFLALGDADVRLVVLRDRSEAPRDFRVAGGDWSALRAALKSIVFDGATNLGDWVPEADVPEYVLVSDGLGNYGDDAFPALAPAQRLFAINSAGASADGARLQALALAHGGRLVDVATPADVAAAVATLVTDAPRLVDIDAVGARDVVAASPFPTGGVLRIAGRMTSPQARVTLEVRDGEATRRVELALDDGEATDGDLVARTWAGYRLRELGAEPERNRTRIRLLGQRFGIATGETSLIVLDTVEDYVRYEIAPPAALLAQFEALRREQAATQAQVLAGHLEGIVEAFADKQQWWERTFPMRRTVRPPEKSRAAPAAAVMAPPSVASADSAASEDSSELDTIVVAGTRVGELQPEEFQYAGATRPEELLAGIGTIHLQPWAPDSPFARRLRAAPVDQVYALYLDEREAHADSTAFYLDVADILLERGQRDLALRVLSNLAELQLENRHVLRVLAYRLMQARAHDLALPLLERVLAMADEEPQSHRDLGLALSATGQPQRAIEALYEVVRRPWDDRFAGVQLIALAELNAIIARAARPLDTRAFDRRLLRNLPLALRTTLTWDADNTDMDLWVHTPDGEACSYSEELTDTGMRFSDDFTGGYGPEECGIRRAPPGKYKVTVNYYGSNAQVVTGAITVQLWLSTDFGTAKQKDEWITVRLAEKKEDVFVGEFEVR
jgi:Ca-activated chloride channel family protein